MKPRLFGTILLLALVAVGCGTRQHKIQYEADMAQFEQLVESRLAAAPREMHKEIEGDLPADLTIRPHTVDDGPRTPWPISVDEAVTAALTNSKVLRDLGGRLIQAPNSVRTIMDPALVETDPRTGVESALSAFDASVGANLFVEKNDFVANSQFQTQGQGKGTAFQQDFSTFQLEVAKLSATGTEYALRHNIAYDNNNADSANFLPHSWDTNVEFEFRHPLLQGNGVAFNRVAGPSGTPGNFNGVVLARLNTDISQVEFEIAVRNLVNNVENAYWDLYFAYRLLESRIEARDASLETWRKVTALEGLQGNAVLEGQANEQYWRFEEELLNAQAGRVINGTRSNNGSSGGTFQGNIGLEVAERRLRLLMGWPINDGRQLRPKDDPAIVDVKFDWDQIALEAVRKRAEVRRQELVVKQRSLELAATRNFLLQRVDLVGLYRFRGLGEDLLNPSRSGREQFDNAYMNLTSGDFQEWQFGIETTMPVGFRQAHAAVRHAQLAHSRDLAVLAEMRREILHDLSNEYANLRRAYKTMQTNFNRRAAARKRLAILKDREQSFGVDLSDMLDAQRRAADADSRFFQSLVEYVVAIKNVHLEKGTLLKYNNVFLTDIAPSDDWENSAPLGASPIGMAAPEERLPENEPLELLPPAGTEQENAPPSPLPEPATPDRTGLRGASSTEAGESSRDPADSGSESTEPLFPRLFGSAPD